MDQIIRALSFPPTTYGTVVMNDTESTVSEVEKTNE